MKTKTEIKARIVLIEARIREIAVRIGDWLRDAEGDLEYVIWPDWAMRLRREASELEDELSYLDSEIQRIELSEAERREAVEREERRQSRIAEEKAWQEKIEAIQRRNNTPEALRKHLENLRRNRDLLRPDCRWSIIAEIQRTEAKLRKLNQPTP